MNAAHTSLRVAGRLGLRLLLWAAAWGLGIVIYLIGVLAMPYAGFETLVCQPFLAALVSAVFVVAAIAAGLPLAMPALKRWWSKAWLFNTVVLVGGLALLFLSQAVGLTSELTDPETGRVFAGPHPGAVVAGYFLVLFAIVNWPRR